MRRRTVLAAIAAATTGGCVSGTAEPWADRSSTETADRSCPSFDEDVDRTVCAATESSDPPVSFGSSGETLSASVEGAVDTLRFELVNRSARTFSFNPSHWRIHRRTDDGWAYVAPEVYNQPLLMLSPGGTYEWELALSSHPSPSGGAKPVVRSLDPGRYAFSVVGSFGGLDADGDDSERADATETDSREETVSRVECVARFRVDE